MHDRSTLWNAVEDVEHRRDAQVAREVRVALPSELTTTQNADLVRAFVAEQFVARGMIADVALHAPGREGDQRNHHAHIMLTTREISHEEFRAKNRDWNAKDLLVDWRGSWAVHVNGPLEQHEISERVDHRTLVAQREDALSLAHDAKERGDAQSQAKHMALAVELDRPALPGMSAGSWSMMRRWVVTPAAERWQVVKHLAAQAREIAAEFKDWARNWFDRLMDGMQERMVDPMVADEPSLRQREPQSSQVPQSALERLEAAREGRAASNAPQTSLERLQAARDSGGRDIGVDVVRNEERAGHELQQQDVERAEALERERLLELKRATERDGPSHRR